MRIAFTVPRRYIQSDWASIIYMAGAASCCPQWGSASTAAGPDHLGIAAVDSSETPTGLPPQKKWNLPRRCGDAQEAAEPREERAATGNVATRQLALIWFLNTCLTPACGARQMPGLPPRPHHSILNPVTAPLSPPQATSLHYAVTGENK